MGANLKTLERIMQFTAEGHLPVGGAIVEIGAQQLRCTEAPEGVRNFLTFFEQRGGGGRPVASFADADIRDFSNGAYFGPLLKAAGFTYLALDLFQAPDTQLFDLNLQFVPDKLRGRFDLVTNYGTTEHVLNQMLAMKTIHDLARPGGLIHHDLPLGGYHEHGYFNYNPVVFREIAAANGYQLLRESFSRGNWRPASGDMRRAGFEDEGYYDRGIEVVVRKTADGPFRIPVETSTSVDIDQDVWRAGVGGAQGAVIVIQQTSERAVADVLAGASFATLQHAYLSRLKHGILRRLRLR